MGISWSKRHRHNQHHQNQVNHHHQPVTPSSSSNPPPPVTPLEPTPLPLSAPPPTLPSTSAPNVFPPQPPGQPPAPTSFSFAANAPYHAPCAPPQQLPPAPPPPPPPPYLPNYNYNQNYSNYYSRPMNSGGQYSNYRPNFMPTGRWGPATPPLPPLPAVPYVDHHSAKKIKNDVNIHKDTIRLQVDVLNKDYQLLTFTFDASVDGSITIFYFAKEGANCTFTPIYPEIVPVKIPFQKGLGQKFCQPSGTGVDLGFFDIDDLARPSPGEDIYPLVISAESNLPSSSTDEQPYKGVNTSPNAQITQAVLETKDGGNFKVKIIKQILWTDGVRYELREIYGISSPDEAAVSDLDSGKECVICMTEEKNTAVLPCRHMCMCSDCAKELRSQSNKCPICRQPIQELLEIKLDEETKT